MSNGEHVDILLVEDNSGDVVLIKEALKDAKVHNILHVARDGVEALDYLYKSLDKKSGIKRPGLVLLDLNLPKKDGREVLKDIKNNDALKTIPVVVMTTSKDEEDIIKAYEYQANCYVTKPVDFDQLMKVVQSIGDFWLALVQLPKSDD